MPFPKSRYEIYQDQRDNPLYNEALQNPDIKSDIPKDLKLLIRLLLSTDPSKRPSCSEIISKITRFKSFDTSVLEEVVTEPESEPPTQPGTPDMMETDHESSQADTSLKRVHTYSTPVTSSVRKRQKRIEHAIEDQSPRLLMDSPAPVERRWLELTDQQLAKVLKTSAMLLKVSLNHCFIYQYIF